MIFIPYCIANDLLKLLSMFLMQKTSHGIELVVYLLLKTSQLTPLSLPALFLSARFRLVARSLSAFLLVQIPAEDQVRLKAGSEPKLTQKAQQVACASLGLLEFSSSCATETTSSWKL